MTERERLLSDILATAVEGGINYWANDRAEDGQRQVYSIERDADANVLTVLFNKQAVENVSGATTIANRLIGHAPEHGELLVIDRKAILRALRVLAYGRVKVHDGIKATARGLYFYDEDTDYDAVDADVILQVALFGDVIYG